MATEQPAVLFINGKWVDCAKWLRHHPGGVQSIVRWHGQDATDAFAALHSRKAARQVANMKAVDPPAGCPAVPQPSSVSANFRKFRQQLVDEGFFERSWGWDITHLVIITTLAVVGTMISYTHPVLATFLIGLSMQQAGWTGHDHAHGRGGKCYILGRLTSGVFNGFSPKWWSNKHNTHHVHTNQMGIDEDIANDPVLHLWLPDPEKEVFFRRFQHLYYHVVYTFLYASWRYQSLVWMYEHTEYAEMAIAAVHYLWMAFLPWQVALGSVLVGGFLVAEIVTATHQSEEMIYGASYEFVADQFRTTRDVLFRTGPKPYRMFMNWLWGGMQFQLIHHLFPTMPRYYYESMVPRVEKFAKENGIDYRWSSMSEIFRLNYETMKAYSTPLDAPVDELKKAKNRLVKKDQ